MTEKLKIGDIFRFKGSVYRVVGFDDAGIPLLIGDIKEKVQFT